MYFRQSHVLLALFLGVGLLHPANVACGDGGTVRAMERSGSLRITAFTSPPILAGGAVDISVLVQDAETNAIVDSPQVALRVVPVDRPYAARELMATSALATNKLFQACHAQLDSGLHDVEVLVTHGDAQSRVRFQLAVPPPATKAASFWPWFTWPLVPIALVLAHRCYGRGIGRASRSKPSRPASKAG